MIPVLGVSPLSFGVPPKSVWEAKSQGPYQIAGGPQKPRQPAQVPASAGHWHGVPYPGHGAQQRPAQVCRPVTSNICSAELL